jgi:hypothetical protein
VSVANYYHCRKIKTAIIAQGVSLLFEILPNLAITWHSSANRQPHHQPPSHTPIGARAGYFQTVIWFCEYPCVDTSSLTERDQARLHTCDPVSTVARQGSALASWLRQWCCSVFDHVFVQWDVRVCVCQCVCQCCCVRVHTRKPKSQLSPLYPCAALVFQMRIQRSAVPPPVASSPCRCGLHARALTAAWCSSYRAVGVLPGGSHEPVSG